MSSLPELLQKRAERLLFNFCREASDDKHRPRHVRYRIDAQKINLYEVRRCVNNSHEHQQLPMAQIRYSPELNQWTLHHQNDQRWQLYLNVTPTLDLGKLLLAIKQDPMGYFWPE